MSDLDKRFQQAQADAKQLPERPDNDTMLKLYGFFKQATEGDVSGEKPGFFDFVGVAKHEAWEKRKGMPADEAKQKYIDLVDSLKR